MIGQSFVPSAVDSEEERRRRLAGGGTSPVQEAIKILSLSIPRFQGGLGAGIGPLGTMSGGGMPGGVDPIVEQVLRQFGINNPAQPGGQAPMPGAPPSAPPPAATKPPTPSVSYAPPPAPPAAPYRDQPRSPFTRQA